MNEVERPQAAIGNMARSIGKQRSPAHTLSKEIPQQIRREAL
jgi:hypothetical protein